MIRVEVKDQKDLERCLRNFKTKVAKSGTPTDAKKHIEYKKPGVKRREEKKEMIKNSRRRNRRSR